MSDKSAIEWTDATWNPVRGCSRVSEGCKNCYAERVAARFSQPGMPYAGLVHTTTQGPKWTGKISLHPELLDQPLRWKRARRIFVNSMSDLFHDDVPEAFITQVFGNMELASKENGHTFQILTKRPERMHDFMTRYAETYMGPPPLVWLGVSVEDQATADERIPLLMQTPAAVRFISAEPLLGPVDLSPFATDSGELYKLHWVIAGGESGPKARPSHPDWFRSLRDQCHRVATPFFFKQWGEWAPGESIMVRQPEDVERVHESNLHKFYPPHPPAFVHKVGKRAAGRLLDGREHNEFPS